MQLPATETRSATTKANLKDKFFISLLYSGMCKMTLYGFYVAFIVNSSSIYHVNTSHAY